MPREKVLRDSDGKTIDVVKQEAEQADITAKAKKVLLVGSDGIAISASNRLPVDTELEVTGNVIVDKVRISGTTDGTEYLPIKVATDGGSPALGKLVCTIA